MHEAKWWKSRMIRIGAGLLGLTMVLLIAAPAIIVYQLTQDHVDYLGYATADYPLQDIYQALDFDLKANEISLTQGKSRAWLFEEGLLLFA